MPLHQPPRDADGNVEPHDHDGVQAGDGVIRRVSDLLVVTDPKTGGRRLSSMAFRASTGPKGGMSVDLEKEIEEAGLEPRAYVTAPRWVGSVRFEAGALRGEGFMVGFDPLPENPYHGEVWGTFSKPAQKRLRELCEWFVPIDGVLIG